MPTEQEDALKDVGRAPRKTTLVRGYALALSLVAAVILTSAALLHSFIVKHYDDTETINVAGAQRMLSQRLVALARELDAREGESADYIRAKLFGSHQRMLSGHSYLTKTPHHGALLKDGSAELQAIYAPDGRNLEQRVDVFLSKFQRILDGGALSSDEVSVLMTEAFGPLLVDLDAAVKQYELAAKNRIADAERLQLILAFSSVLLLVAIGVFVLHPLARRAEGEMARAESALEERSKLLSQSLSVARMGYWVLEFQDRDKLWLSQEIADLYRIPERGQQWVPTELMTSMVHEELDSVADAVERCASEHETQSVRSRIKLDNGRTITLYTLMFPRFDSDGNVIGVNGVARDVTHEEEQKQNLEIRTKQLSEAQALGKMAMWTVDVHEPDGLIKADDDFFELIGHTPGSFELTEANLLKLHANPQVSVPKVEQLFEQIRETGEAGEIDVDLVREDGEIATIRARQKLEFDEAGNPTSIFGTIQCITAQKKMERQLIVRSEQLSEAQSIGMIAMWRRVVGSDTFELDDDYYRMLGYEPGAFPPTEKGLQSVQVDAESDYRKILSARRRTLQSNEVQTFESRIKRADGTVADIQIRQKVELDEDGEIVARFGTMQDITERREAERQLEQLAFFDHLTGLGNRAMFTRKLDALAEDSKTADGLSALLLLDLDKFKEINDGLGHDAGDAFLCEVAERLTRLGGRDAFAARLGGDEFAVLLTGMPSKAAIGARAQEIVDAIAEPARVKNGEVVSGASIGVAVLPNDTSDPEEAMRFADLALYHAKDGGRNCSIFFSPAMSETMLDRLSLARSLRGAAERGELASHFQPIVAGDGLDVIGFEALLRWNCPGRGMVPPSQFIPIAESSHIISTLGEFVFRDACATLRSWIDAGLPPKEISINVSATQLWTGDLEEMIDHALKESGVPPSYICLELTESVFVGDALPRIEGLLRRLKGRGLKLALDDFGTGYSSLGYLNRLPFDKLKIDRCFVSDVDTNEEKRELLTGIVGLARGLGMKTVAEGVETEGELDIVRDLGCDQIQGFYFGKPKPAQEAVTGAAEITNIKKLKPLLPEKPTKDRRRVRRG